MNCSEETKAEIVKLVNERKRIVHQLKTRLSFKEIGLRSGRAPHTIRDAYYMINALAISPRSPKDMRDGITERFELAERAKEITIRALSEKYKLPKSSIWRMAKKAEEA